MQAAKIQAPPLTANLANGPANGRLMHQACMKPNKAKRTNNENEKYQ
jgi:hypothetical protein